MKSNVKQLVIKEIDEALERIQSPAGETQLTKSNYDYLMQNILISSPQDAFNNLVSSTQIALKKFDKEYPAKQSATVRRCLAKIYSTIETIQRDALYSFIQLDIYDPKTLRQGYYQLFGLLVELRLIVEEKKGHIPKALLQTLKTIFNKNSLYSNEKVYINFTDSHEEYLDLIATPKDTLNDSSQETPSEDNSEKTPKDEVVDTSRSYLRLMTKFELRLYEIKTYNEFLKLTKSTVDKFPRTGAYNQVFLNANRVLAKIVAANPTKSMDTDLKLFITTLKNINDILSLIPLSLVTVDANHKDSDFISAAALKRAAKKHAKDAFEQCADFKKFIRHIENGKPSILKRITGSLLILVGAITMLISGFTQLYTFGLTIPISSIGAGIGLTTILAGIGLFHSGRQKGLSKALYNLSDSLSNACVAPEEPAAKPDLKLQRLQRNPFSQLLSP
jgi:hypothetical protein